MVYQKIPVKYAQVFVSCSGKLTFASFFSINLIFDNYLLLQILTTVLDYVRPN